MHAKNKYYPTIEEIIKLQNYALVIFLNIQ